MKNLLLSLVVLASVFMFSCNKEETGIVSNEDEAIVSNDAAVDMVTDAADYEVELFTGSTESINLASGALKSTSNGPFGGWYRFGMPPEVIITLTDGGFPITVSLNYGEGIELMNGTTISGSIFITVSAKPRTAGAIRTVTFNNFYVDSVNIAGTRTMTFSVGEGGNIINNIVGSVVITFPDGTYITRETEKTREFYAGFDTPADHSDDIFHITGFTNSVSSEGFTFSNVIQVPLVRKGGCRYIVEGISALSKNGEVFAELNFGDGTCDDIATITKDGVERQITLGRRHRIYQN